MTFPRAVPAAATAAAVVVAVLAGCASDLGQLDADYRAGVEARASLLRHGETPTEHVCADMYITIDMYTAIQADHDSSHVGDRVPVWDEQRRTVYVNGCLGLPQHPSPSSPPVVSAGAGR